MSVRTIALVAAVVALGIPAAYAQTTPEAAPVAAAASAPMDCKGMAKHDHAAERGMPKAMPAGCSASPAKVKAAKAKAGHDHAKFHKLM